METEAPTVATSGVFLLGGDLPVHRLGFGAMRVTGEGVWGEPDDPAEAKRLLRRVVELGIDLIDTADAYGPGVSERLIAEALHPYPDRLVIATKGGSVRPGRGAWERDGRPEHLRAALEGSLARLRLERIDLYQLHAPDRHVPIEVSVRALAELRGEGKIRHVGLSNVDVRQLETARGIVEIASVQNRYNLADRRSDPVLAACERANVAFLPWRPLDVGELGGPDGPLARIARRHGAAQVQVALAWLLARSPVMLPIPGTSSVAHLDENAAAAALELTRAEVEELTALGVRGGRS